jgi:aspartyl-tRNA(Asn)/glutamyl-tRNA(Gln) amidotransferase subunit A
MVEIAGGGGYEYANASLHGPGLNPWNLDHWSGGSSSGSGSAVAAGLVPFALGSETWGSIVTPSTYCGITGLRPSFGLVSRHGAMELAWSMDKVGPMARSAEDCGWVLQAIAGRDSNDLTTIVDRFIFRPRAARRTLRLGILPTDLADAPEVAKAFDEALRGLRKAGIKIAQTKFPDYTYEEPARTILNGEMAAAHEEFFKSARLDELVDAGQKNGMKKSLEVTAAAYVKALKKRDEMRAAVLAVFDEFDALVSPSLKIEAITLDTNLQTAFKTRRLFVLAPCGVPNLTADGLWQTRAAAGSLVHWESIFGKYVAAIGHDFSARDRLA